MKDNRQDMIEQLGEKIQERFTKEGKPISFNKYLEIFLEHPELQSRSAAHYIRDTFDYFGMERIETPVGEVKRFKMFDAPFCQGDGRVAGQEKAQEAIYGLLNNFVRTGRVDRLILLHGPNGSAKTSIIRAIVRAMEHYSSTDEGALYRFRWIFPSEKVDRSGAIGFGGEATEGAEALDTFANLDGEQIDAVLECELKDHPLLLVPVEQRQELFNRLMEEGRLPRDFPIPEYLWRGDLCAQCRKIYDALLASYNGNAAEVLRHIQVVRMNVSGRYRKSAAIVEPQMHVDAGEAQVTASKSLASLPRAIAHLNLYQPRGPLVDANRGLLEYNDLLKRHIDTFKYLLVTCESGQVALEQSTLFLDTVFIGSTNEMLLDAFKEYADFASFKGRLEFVRVPYLRRISQEKRIYQDQIKQKALGVHLAPHTLELAATWAVMTRLNKPQAPQDASSDLKDTVGSLNPLEKALLYDGGEVPPRLSTVAARDLANFLPDMYRISGSNYEGRIGASAREIRMILMNAAQQEQRSCVSPLGLFDEIRDLISQKSIFTFLQAKSEDDFMNQDRILELLDEHFLDMVENEVAQAMGLVTESSYQVLFDRYIQHVSHWLRDEKLTDPVSGQSVSPSNEIMAEVEGVIRTGDQNAEEFRKNLISRIGAYALDAEKQGEKIEGKPDYSKVFPTMFDKLRTNFMEKRKELINHNIETYFAAHDGRKLQPKDEEMVQRMKTNMKELGYCDSCAQECMAYLQKRRICD